jgi:hypothetical protein
MLGVSFGFGDFEAVWFCWHQARMSSVAESVTTVSMRSRPETCAKSVGPNLLLWMARMTRRVHSRVRLTSRFAVGLM